MVIFQSRFWIISSPREFIVDAGKKTEPKGDSARKAEEQPSPESSPSPARENGRRLTLKFNGAEVPVLDEISFTPKTGDDPNLWNLTPPNKQYSWSEVPKALSLFFIQYLAWGKTGQRDVFYFQGRHKGSLAATLGDAVSGKGPIHELFEEALASGKFQDQTRMVFEGQNVHGRDRDKKDRRITVHPNYLPPDCVEIVWDDSRLKTLEELQALERQLRQSAGIPDDVTKGNGSSPEGTPRQEVLDGTVDTQLPKDKPAVEPSIPAEPFKLSKWLAHEFGQALDALQSRPRVKAPQPKRTPKPTGEGKPENAKPAAPEEKLTQPGFKQKPPRTALELFPDEPGATASKPDVGPSDAPDAKPPTETQQVKDAPAQKPKPLKSAVELFGTPIKTSQPGGASSKPDVQTGGWAIHFKPATTPAQPKPEPKPVEFPPPEPQPPIDPRLFQITNPQGHTWDDDEGLLNFGNDESNDDVWCLRDACEGTLIFGAVGSGKTSGSGSAIARAFLQSGFGGLVLTAKPDEARRWVRMCQETGRTEDLIHLTPGSGHKLNFLQYETQRPGERLAVTDDLIALFRCLLDVISQSKKSGGKNEEFWINATDQLMRKLFNVFLLAGEPLSLDRLVRFLNHAPKDLKTNWREDATFGRVIKFAEENAKKGNDEDKRIFQEAFEYWTQEYPLITEGTRSGIITSFSAMADHLSGRGIHEMIGTTTNLTPEMILSGKVVVLDIPLKGNVQSGLMVQAIWKLLFQQAAERRADKGHKTARPAFLWEDEGHMFFSQNDTNFQPTARDIRAPHVIISQNLHNFLQQGHNEHAFYAVFAAMNTYIFHTNGDLETNHWASAHIGEIRKLKLTTDGLLKPMQDKDYTFLERRPEDVKNVGTMKISEEKKSAMPPEDFAKLKRGGDGTCEAVLVWLSHQFTANNKRNFCVLTFEQEPRPA
jgi:hypothetical protein